DQGGGTPEAVVKMDPQLKGTLAATYFGGPYFGQINALTLDASGNVYIGGATLTRGLPTRTPFVEAFGLHGTTGFLSELSGDLSTLLFSSYLGDTQLFSVKSVAIGASGSAIIGGSTGSAFPFNPQPINVVINSIAVTPPAPLRIDGVWNAASLLGGTVSAGETIVVRGAGFGPDAQLSIGGFAVTPLAIAANSITAIIPSALATGAAIVQVQSGGAASNQMAVLVTSASPGIFSVDGSGFGQGYILNQDGTMNSQGNPAAPGSRITLFATGAGSVSLTDGYAVTGSSSNVFIDGFYCDGVAAVMANVAGLPGPVYELTVIVPTSAQIAAINPDLKNFIFPPQSALVLKIAGANSQNWIAIWIGQ
ncbi:MAG TPA: IPT/TIG domain-containing protein, partial [Bryobacteraceae bacterium]|nr:IPT/TIG domain-containing protein [Bryobacteraceae bacterium]